jgi:hypothetical protein
MLLSTSVATRLDPPRGRAAKRRGVGNYVSSRNFAHASQRRQMVSNCALAASSVDAWLFRCTFGGLPTTPYSDQNQRILSGRPRSS